MDDALEAGYSTPSPSLFIDRWPGAETYYRTRRKHRSRDRPKTVCVPLVITTLGVV